jgi:glucose/arabinose dehydrogenase
MGPGPHWTGTASLRRTTRSWQGRRRHARMPCSGGCAADYPARFEDQPIVSGLTASTTAAYAPDGRLFIAEKGGRLEAREPGESAATTILDISHKVNDSYDRGLLGLPSIASSRAMATSICSTSTTSAYSATATVRWSRGSRGLAWTEQTTFRVRRSCSARTSAGRVRHRPTRWIACPPTTARTLSAPWSLRLKYVCTKLHAKGFRNPFRFELRDDGAFGVGDVGWNSREEVDVARVGKSFGWPCYEGRLRTAVYEDNDHCAGPAGTQARCRAPRA